MKSGKTILKLFYWIIGICLIGACSEPSTVKIPANGFSTTPVNKWICIGPIKFDTILQDPVRTFYNNDLKEFGIDEENFKKADIELLPESVKIFEIEDKEGSVDLIKYATEYKLQLSNFYLFTEVESELEQSVVFITDGSFAYKIWLNGQEIISEYWKKNTNKGGDRYITVHLKKGMNTVFAKVSRGNNVLSWKLNLTISNFEEAQKVFFDNCLSDFIANPNFTDTLSVYVGPNQSGKIELINSVNNHVDVKQPFLKENIKEGYVNLTQLQHLEDGFYTARLLCQDSIMEEKVYKGDLLEVKAKFHKQFSALDCDSSFRKEIAASINKFNYLAEIRPDSLSRYEKQYWKNNSVFYGFNTNSAFQYLAQNKSLKGCPGTLIKSYHSEKYNRTFYFLFHSTGTPEEIASKPVVIMIPYALEGNDFNTSWYFTSLDQLEIDAYLADKKGFSIAWVFLRGSEYTIEAADEDVLGAIGTLVSDYNIPHNNFYLEGDCVGGYRALLIASRNPDKIAGVTANGPITTGEGGYGPINLVRNLYNVPACIVHGNEDKVVPIGQSEQYIQEAKKFGIDPVFSVWYSKGKYSLSKAYHGDSFDKLKGFHTSKKNGEPAEIKYITYEKETKSIYWLDLSPNFEFEASEISIAYEKDKAFKIESKGIDEISIDTKRLNINPDAEINIISNNNGIYKGKVSFPKMKLKITEVLNY